MIKPGFITNSIYHQLIKKAKPIQLTKKVKPVTKKVKPTKSISNLPKKGSTLPKNVPGLKNLGFTKTFSRNTLVLPFLLGKTFLVHNGKIFLKVLVSENMVGHKLGEFSQTRRRYFYKKGKKIKNSGNKKK